MKLTKSKLKQIIKEELAYLLNERKAKYYITKKYNGEMLAITNERDACDGEEYCYVDHGNGRVLDEDEVQNHWPSALELGRVWYGKKSGTATSPTTTRADRTIDSIDPFR